MQNIKTVWPGGLRRWLHAPVRKGVGSNPAAVMQVTLAARSAMNRAHYRRVRDLHDDSELILLGLSAPYVQQRSGAALSVLGRYLKSPYCTWAGSAPKAEYQAVIPVVPLDKHNQLLLFLHQGSARDKR